MALRVNTIKPSPPKITERNPTKNVVSLKVVDFTIWNGVKFGMGFTLGGIAVYGACSFLEMLFYFIVSFTGMGPGI